MQFPRSASTNATPLAGIACVSVGILFLTCSDALAKWVGQYYSPVQLLFLRAAIAFPVVFVLVVALGGRRALRSRHLGLHLVRGAINIISASFFYLSLQSLPLAEAIAIAFSAPLFVTALSVLVLKERVDGARWLAVAAGFAGVLVIVRPGAASFQVAALLPLATAALYAVMMLTSRAIGAAESMLTTTLYIVVGQLVCSAVVVPAFWTPPQWSDWPYFAGIALFSTLGLTFITQGFRIGPASVVAPFDYTGLLWASLLGWMVWQDTPDVHDSLGAAFIVGSGLYIAWRETRPINKRNA
ncbi:DMT family transporter [Bordetella tumulicola]|uniref:DMT family transporter n=1 Tax=Bordetella tumulicola TaxID=1649133 RepID=UPI0039F0F836